VIARRDFFIAGACVLGAGVAYELVPRRHVSLLGPTSVASIVPRQITGWTSRDVTDLVAPKIENSLASRLYGETVGRTYHSLTTGAEVMMLLAHGDTQSNDLQLHRPEICYPSFGFAISDNHPIDIALSSSVSVPSRSLVARAADRQETILYWSRLGEYLPIDRKQQQFDRLRTAMAGIVADGILARFSVAGMEPNAATAVMLTFIKALLLSVAPQHRSALIGTIRADQLRQEGV